MTKPLKVIPVYHSSVSIRWCFRETSFLTRHSLKLCLWSLKFTYLTSLYRCQTNTDTYVKMKLHIAKEKGNNVPDKHRVCLYFCNHFRLTLNL